MSVKATTTVSISPAPTALVSSSSVSIGQLSSLAASVATDAVVVVVGDAVDEATEQRHRPSLLAEQLLGMTLHGHDHPVRRLDALDDTVGAVRGACRPGATSFTDW